MRWGVGILLAVLHSQKQSDEDPMYRSDNLQVMWHGGSQTDYQEILAISCRPAPFSNIFSHSKDYWWRLSTHNCRFTIIVSLTMPHSLVMAFLGLHIHYIKQPRDVYATFSYRTRYTVTPEKEEYRGTSMLGNKVSWVNRKNIWKQSGKTVSKLESHFNHYLRYSFPV